jgi:cell wall-associated NlpC family hydrolase
MKIDSERGQQLHRQQQLTQVLRVAIPLALALIGLVALSGTAAAQTVTVTPSATATPTTAAATASPTATTEAATPTATVPGPTATPVPGLTLSPQQGPPNTSVGGTGTNFAPGDSVQLLFNGTQVDSKQADTTGLVNFQFNVPTLANGQYPVLATGKTRGSAKR